MALLQNHGTTGSSFQSHSSVPDFETIYQQYFRFVWNSTRRLGIDLSATDDVVQEVFLVIHQKLDTLRDPTALRSWIYGIVRRTASSHRRKNKSQHESIADWIDTDTLILNSASPLAEAEQRAQIQLLFGILSQMKEAKREIFILVELEEMSIPEVSEALEIPLNTAYSRLRLARTDFETALKRKRKSSERGALA